MSSIYVLRHAQSQGNADPSLYQTMFNPDIPLSEEGKAEASKAAKLLQKDIPNSVGIYSSNYLRAIQTAEIIKNVLGKQNMKQNIFLAERKYGEQEGCNDVNDFNTRPMERYAYGKAGHIAYTPLRGESLLDVQVRVTLFVLQQDSFRFTPAAIIISHASTCLMFHAYFTGELPTLKSKWKNCEIRKYIHTGELSSQFVYEGQLE